LLYNKHNITLDYKITNLIIMKTLIVQSSLLQTLKINLRLSIYNSQIISLIIQSTVMKIIIALLRNIKTKA